MLRIAALLLVGVLAVACGGDPEPVGTDRPKPCTGLGTPAAGAPTELPLGLPLTRGSQVIEVVTQGKTTIAFATLPGDRDDIVTARDTVLTDLVAKGFTVVGTDQEPGFEAEAELAGTHRGTLQVTPLCQDVLQLRYKINQ